MRRLAIVLVTLALLLSAAAATIKHQHRLVLALKPQDPRAADTLEELFWNVSTPGHAQFRQFLDVPQLCDLVRAAPETVAKAKVMIPKALGAAGLIVEDADVTTELGVCSDFMFATFVSTHTPATLALHVSKIKASPLLDAVITDVYTPRVSDKKKSGKVLDKQSQDGQQQQGVQAGFPGMNVNVYVLRGRYNIPEPETIPGPNSPIFKNFSQAVAEFEGEQFIPANIAAFNKNFSLPPPNLGINGPNKGGYFGEGTLDLQYINGLTPNVKTWWVADKYFDIVHFSETLLQTPGGAPAVVSVSWGGGESGYSAAQVSGDNAALKKLGLLGITVLSASGDVGTGTTGFWSCGHFDPTWPASSPYLTAVGACYANSNTTDEIGWSGSGGGFSTSIPQMPSYQRDAVYKYLNNTNVTLPDAKYWTCGGRATPDVSALGTNFEIYSYDWATVSGTSAATPTFAAIISRINIERLMKGEAGAGRLGFLNPSLYKLGKVGHDIVQGDNKNPSCPQGFQAAPGWDPVTGLGTPDYKFLVDNL